jgi:hypothetical protein
MDRVPGFQISALTDDVLLESGGTAISPHRFPIAGGSSSSLHAAQLDVETILIKLRSQIVRSRSTNCHRLVDATSHGLAPISSHGLTLSAYVREAFLLLLTDNGPPSGYKIDSIESQDNIVDVTDLGIAKRLMEAQMRTL